MTLNEFSTNSQPPHNVFILACAGGYFKGWTMKNIYLIGEIDEALIIRSLQAATIWKNDIGRDAKICKVTRGGNFLQIQKGNKKLIY